METPRDPTSIRHRLREGLSRIATVIRADDWERAKLAGVNPTQLAILELLEGRTAGLSVKEIAFHLGVSQPTATDSIGALERKGYVEKHAADGDRRGVKVVIAGPGLAAFHADDTAGNMAEQAAGALTENEQTELLSLVVKMIRHLQEQDAIPIQRMCVTCRYFMPFAHQDEDRPHHCAFVDAAFGQRDIRIDCRDHEIADPAVRAATWTAFTEG